MPIHFSPQVSFITDTDGRLLVNRILHLETLTEELPSCLEHAHPGVDARMRSPLEHKRQTRDAHGELVAQVRGHMCMNLSVGHLKLAPYLSHKSHATPITPSHHATSFRPPSPHPLRMWCAPPLISSTPLRPIQQRAAGGPYISPWCLTDYYTSRALVRKVAFIYADDFEVGGYSTSLPDCAKSAE